MTRIDDGRLCMSNNAAERELRARAIGRKNGTFAGSDEGGRHQHLDRNRQAQRSIRKLGSPTCSPACLITRPSASTNYCLGIGTVPSPKKGFRIETGERVDSPVGFVCCRPPA
jgi:Transposase IS66 family